MAEALNAVAVDTDVEVSAEGGGVGTAIRRPKASVAKALAVSVALLAVAALAAACETFTIEPDEVLVVCKSGRPFSRPPVDGFYNKVVLGLESEVLIYVPLTPETLPPGLDVRSIDKVSLELQLHQFIVVPGAVRFGVYRVRSDWRDGAGDPEDAGSADAVYNLSTLRYQAMRNWPPQVDDEPFYTFLLAGSSRSNSRVPYFSPDTAFTVVSIDLTTVAQKWLEGTQGQPNYGILIKPLPGQDILPYQYWTEQGHGPVVVIVSKQDVQS